MALRILAALAVILSVPVPASQRDPADAGRGVRILAVEAAPALGVPPVPDFPFHPDRVLAVSPDGSKVVFGGMGDRGDFGLGSSFDAVHMVDVREGRSVWARDAYDVLFVSDREFVYWNSDKLGEGEIGLLQLPGPSLRFVYPPPEAIRKREKCWSTFVSWNARTGELAFVQRPPGRHPSIHALRLRDQRVRPLLGKGDHPIWSPDGAHLLYTQPKDGDSSRGATWIYTPGSRPRKVGEGSAIAWLSDNRSILVKRPGSNDKEIPLFRVDTLRRRWTLLATRPWYEWRFLHHSPSGRWLSIRRETGRVVLLHTLSGEQIETPLESDFPPFFGKSDEDLYFRVKWEWKHARLSLPTDEPEAAE
jgi:hypothetical protein